MASRIFAILATLLVAAIACAGETPHEELAKKMLASLDKIASTLKSIDSEDAARIAKPDLRKAAESWVEARTQASKLQPPEKAEKERLAKIYRPKLDETLKKMFVEIQRVNVIPGGADALKEIAVVLKKDDKK